MRNRFMGTPLLWLLILLMAPRVVIGQDANVMAPAARQYLEHALRIMEAEALNRGKVNWAQIRADASRAAAGAQHPKDTHLAIAAALRALGDNHSGFMPAVVELPGGLEVNLETIVTGQARPGPVSRRIGARVGYVSVPGFSGAGATDFAEQILDRIMDVDGPAICAWIVDVRGNTGGNMWPMLQGLSPVIGDGIPGYFVAPDSSWTGWRVETERVGNRKLASDRVAVAILHGSETASSGEAVVVAFRGRPETRTFGQPTRGLSTANRSIPLSDGARMILTVAVFADRDRTIYGKTIAPDELIASDTPEDHVFAIVEEWLLRQPACAKDNDGDITMR